MSKFLIAGLGNMSSEYAGTRHNIGFDVVDYFAYKHNAAFTLKKLAALTEISWKGKTIICIKPSTYMNLSGDAVKYWIDKEKISIENTLIVVDDLALPLSKLRLRPSGTHAGHNGLRSIQESLNSDAYPKLRFGIGNKFPRGMQADFVLSKWWPEELPLVRLKIEKSVELIESFISIGIERTMNLYNKLEYAL
jgi:peptidyl-tRNA hydrolase, PTH1 family